MNVFAPCRRRELTNAHSPIIARSPTEDPPGAGFLRPRPGIKSISPAPLNLQSIKAMSFNRQLKNFEPKTIRTSLNEAEALGHQILQLEEALVERLQDIDKNRFYLWFGHRSLRSFCEDSIGFSRTQSQRLVTLVRRARPPMQKSNSPSVQNLVQSPPMNSSFQKNIELNVEQKWAGELFKGSDNLFLTGAAGTGKSHLIRLYLEGRSSEEYPILASTAAAAILIGGRTFHSFFGIGIVEGGYLATLARALRNRKLAKRLKKAKSIVIDEVSMLSGTHLRLAEEVSRKTLKSELPWGGLRIIAVGDFAQLPPVNVFQRQREWAFQDAVWRDSGFTPILLTQIMRSSDRDYLEVLGDIREGRVTQQVREFLNSRVSEPEPDFEGTRLFARRDLVENYNLSRLNQIEAKTHRFETVFDGKAADVEKFKKNVPIPEVLQIKVGALVMFRQNDNDGRWVNGSLGTVNRITDEAITISLLDGREVETERADFTMLDADGMPVAKANNFPIQLAWALTIHKAQGTTLDRMRVDIKGLWEPGQAYVALSRVKTPKDLHLDSWSESSIFMDPSVKSYLATLKAPMKKLVNENSLLEESTK